MTVIVMEVEVIMVAKTDAAGKFVVIKFMAITYGLSNDSCDGGSSKNECNGNFDLSHL
jgi:hypothetical protein